MLDEVGLQQKFKEDFRSTIDMSERRDAIVYDSDIATYFAANCNGLDFNTVVVDPYDKDLTTSGENLKNLLSFFDGDTDYDGVREEFKSLLRQNKSLKADNGQDRTDINNELFDIAIDVRSTVVDNIVEDLSVESHHYKNQMAKCLERSAPYFEAVERITFDLLKEVFQNGGVVTDMAVGDSFGYLLDDKDTLMMDATGDCLKLPHLKFSSEYVKEAARLTAPSVFVTCVVKDGSRYVVRVADFDDRDEYDGAVTIPCILKGSIISSVEKAEGARDYQLVVDQTSKSIWDIDDGDFFEAMGGSDTGVEPDIMAGRDY